MDSDNKEKDVEMQKLYDAIGYSENEVITPFPKEVCIQGVRKKVPLLTL